MDEQHYPVWLRWDEVDPATHPFDPAKAAETVRALAPPGPPPPEPRAGTAWTETVTRALVAHYGPWASGWCWGVGESHYDGGPIGAWCCASHSITGREETLQRVAAGLREWRGWLEDLVRWFDTYPLDLSDVEDQRILWERTARNLIFQVADRTGHESGWYGHCYQVLRWFLCYQGIDTDAADRLVEQAIGGRFESWVAPDAALADDISETLAGSLSPADAARSAGPPPDHLRGWIELRKTVPWHAVPGDGSGRGTVEGDAVVEHIRSFDQAISPARARGLLAALELARTDAARGARLDFALLSSWQQLVLGTRERPSFRTLPAFAKQGRERYGIAPGLLTEFSTCLAQSSDDAALLSLPARAARAYLDVCFFHPFDDGNARAAFLTLVFVLAREGTTLDDVDVIRRVSFDADAADQARMLGTLINNHLVWR